MLDYGFRIYNPAIARFLSVDPLTRSYPWYTPYQFASNRPIDGIDLDGLEYLRAQDSKIEVINGRTQLKIENLSNPSKAKVASAEGRIVFAEGDHSSPILTSTFPLGRGYAPQLVKQLRIQSDTKLRLYRDVYFKKIGAGSHQRRKYRKAVERQGYRVGVPFVHETASA